LLLGASCLQVCTAVMHYGFRIVEDLCHGLIQLDGRERLRNGRRSWWVGSLHRLSDFNQFDLSFPRCAAH